MPGITFTEGSGLQDSIYGKAQAPIKMLIEKKAEAFEKKSLLPVLFSMDTSEHFAESFEDMTAMSGPMPVGENGQYPMDSMQESYKKTLKHEVWKDSFSISREIIDDSKTIDLKHKPTAFITAHERVREQFGAALYGGAMAKATNIKFRGMSFPATTADGKNLFATDHPSILGKPKQSNLFADAFSEDALGAMECAMQDFRGDKAEVQGVAPNTILIPNDAELKKAVFAAIGADKDPSTANNGFNYLFGRWRVVVWQYLNEFIDRNSKPWALLDTDFSEEYAGAVWLDRVKLEVRSELASNDANIWKGYARWSAGFANWRFAAVGGVSGGTQLLRGA